MSRASDALREERKALLSTRAELDRARVAFSVREIKAVVMPARDPQRALHYRPAASMLVRILGPIAGASRLGRWVRVASMTLAAIRIARNWKSP